MSEALPTIVVFGRRYGDFVARIPALAGCGGVGATKEDEIERARGAARAYLATAPDRSGRLATWRSLDPATFPVEESDGGFIEHDQVALGNAELADLAALFTRWSVEIRQLTAGLQGDVSEARRGEDWSVREIRDHMAETQVRWLSRLDALTDGSFRTHEQIDALVSARIADLGATSGQDREILGGRWSARRVVRRLLEHQLEHLGHIRETLARLGGPAER
jgi:predicted RNase H-like HicB family nuclease